jgi:hypothetical protein
MISPAAVFDSDDTVSYFERPGRRVASGRSNKLEKVSSYKIARPQADDEDG